MGILSTIGGWLSSAADAVFDAADAVFDKVSDHFGSNSSLNSRGDSGSHHSSTNTNVQIIEDKDRVRTAELENERVGLMESLMKTQTQMTLAIEEAKARGFVASQQAMAAMLAELSRLGNESYVVMENNMRGQIHQVESLYQELTNDITTSHSIFMEQKLPQLVAQLEQFEPDSPLFKLYYQAIDKETALQFEFMTQQIKQMGERRKAVVESVIRSKENMQSHIQALSQRSVAMLEQHQQQSFALPNAHNGNAQTPALLDTGVAPALENRAKE